MKPSPIAAVIGHPIGHSRSPAVHGHWLKRHGIKGHYVALDISEADFAKALELLPRIGFVGANVTLPHKSRALMLANQATDLARRIGASNTLVFRGTTIEADNTDAEGFLRNIRAGHPNWMPRRVALIGAGGASRAVVAALEDAGATDIRATNRSPERTAELVRDFPGLRGYDWSSRHDLLEDCDTLINATSQGMLGQPPLDLALDRLPRSAIVNDLIYVPLETPLLAAARARGNPVVDGLGMLLHQAAPGFFRWFGIMPEVDDRLRAAVMG